MCDLCIAAEGAERKRNGKALLGSISHPWSLGVQAGSECSALFWYLSSSNRNPEPQAAHLSFFERLFLPSVPKEAAKESPGRPESGCEILGRGCAALGLLSHTVGCGGVFLARGEKGKEDREGN